METLARWILAAAVVAMAAAACSDAGNVVHPSNVTTFDATWEFRAPTRPTDRPCPDLESAEPDRPCQVEVLITVENMGDARGDVRCLIMLLDDRDRIVGAIEFQDSRVAPGESTYQDAVISVTGPVDHHREHCPAYDPGALEGVG